MCRALTKPDYLSASQGNWAQHFSITCIAFSSGHPSAANYFSTHNGSLMAHHTHEQLAAMKNEQKLKARRIYKVTVFLAYSKNVSARAPNGVFFFLFCRV